MSDRESTTYDWLRHIPRGLLELDEVPLFGHITPFPYEALSLKLAEALSLDGLTVRATNAEWRTKESLFDSLGDDLAPLNFSLSGMEGGLTWVMPRHELDVLAHQLLQNGDAAAEALGDEFSDGLYRFLGYQVLQAMANVDWEKSFAIHILNQKTLPAEDSFTVDILATWNDHALAGRLIISPNLERSFKQRFADRSMQVPGFKEHALMETVETQLIVESGSTKLPKSVWKTVRPGDFVLLDSCTINPSGVGSVLIRAAGTPLFRASIQSGAITITEKADYHMADEEMDEHDDTASEGIEDDEEFDDEFDEDLDEEEGTEEEGVTEEAAAVEAEKPLEAIPAEDFVKEEAPPATPDEVPMPITVEVARFKMSFAKLMDLKPGNVIDLKVNPADGVDLTVGGKRIAKGELLIVGDVLGVRILDIG